eukprot:gene4062-20239_t
MTESVTFIVCKELLDMQEKSFKALVTMLVDGLKADVKDIKFELNEVKNSLNFSGRDIAVIQDRIKVLSNQLKEVNVQVFNHHESLGHVLGKQEYLENQSRQNKVFVTGIQESGKERWDETEDVLKSKIKELLKINDDLTIERAHRVNPKPNRRHGSYGARGGRKEDRSRPIIAKFLNWKEKERVLAAARSIKPDGVKFVQDSSQATLDRSPKAKVPVGEPRTPEADTTHNRRALTQENVVLESSNQKYHFANLSPSVDLIVDIPLEVISSFFSKYSCWKKRFNISTFRSS